MPRAGVETLMYVSLKLSKMLIVYHDRMKLNICQPAAAPGRHLKSLVSSILLLAHNLITTRANDR